MNQCLRCGMTGHRWKFCFKSVNAGNANGYQAASFKRKREEHIPSTRLLLAGNEPKRLKPSAALTSVGGNPSDNSGLVIAAAQSRRFYEQSEGDESDFR